MVWIRGRQRCLLNCLSALFCGFLPVCLLNWPSRLNQKLTHLPVHCLPACQRVFPSLSTGWPVCLPIYLTVSLPDYLPACLHVLPSPSASLSVSLPIYLPICLRDSLSACLYVFPSLSTSLPACLPIYLKTCLSASRQCSDISALNIAKQKWPSSQCHVTASGITIIR